MNHDPARLAEIRSLAGISTPKPRVADQLTAMQAVSYVAGEPLSERPACTDRLLAPFVSSWGEDLDDVERNALLLPLVPELVGAHRGPAQFFGNLALAWMLRDALPAWLRVAGHKQTERFEAQLPAPVSPAAIEAWTFEVEALGRFLPYTLGQDFGDELVGVELTRQVLPLLGARPARARRPSPSSSRSVWDRRSRIWRIGPSRSAKSWPASGARGRRRRRSPRRGSATGNAPPPRP